MCTYQGGCLLLQATLVEVCISQVDNTALLCKQTRSLTVNVWPHGKQSDMLLMANTLILDLSLYARDVQVIRFK